MKIASNTVLVTGGASGIGLAIVERFLAAGSKVVVCGRREDKLAELRTRHPLVSTRICDVSEASEREELAAWVTREHPDLNVLVNNAGIQRRLDVSEGQRESWNVTRQEISINLEAPIHLSGLLIPHLLKQREPAILNVTSGLSFAPLANVPVYSATKAAFHSFTLSLRHQLSKTPIQVIEIAPPAVDTDLGGPGLHTFGVDVNEFADAVFRRLAAGETEIAYGTAEKASRASREELDRIFQLMNSREA